MRITFYSAAVYIFRNANTISNVLVSQFKDAMKPVHKLSQLLKEKTDSKATLAATDSPAKKFPKGKATQIEIIDWLHKELKRSVSKKRLNRWLNNVQKRKLFRRQVTAAQISIETLELVKEISSQLLSKVRLDGGWKEGVFRKSGNTKRLKEWMELIGCVGLEKASSIQFNGSQFDLADLLKRIVLVFCKETIPKGLMKLLQRIHSISNQETREEATKFVIDSLPHRNFMLLMGIAEIAFALEGEPTTKMTLKNFSSVFAPNLCSQRIESVKVASLNVQIMEMFLFGMKEFV